VNLFLDTSVLLAACGSAKGSSRAIFHLANAAGWTLMSSPYALGEAMRNLGKLPTAATAEWVRLREQLKIVDDIVSPDQPTIFFASKDRPILLTALAWSDALITLDRDDFAKFLGSQFYGLRVRLPFNFLDEERREGRLKISRP
jgi:predicted nucleic acid-binding protein